MFPPVRMHEFEYLGLLGKGVVVVESVRGVGVLQEAGYRVYVTVLVKIRCVQGSWRGNTKLFLAPPQEINSGLSSPLTEVTRLSAQVMETVVSLKAGGLRAVARVLSCWERFSCCVTGVYTEEGSRCFLFGHIYPFTHGRAGAESGSK